MKHEELFVVYPSISGRPVLNSFSTLYQSMLHCGHQVTLHCPQGESLVNRMRDYSIATFLKSKASYYISVDDDIEICNPPLEYNFISRLLEHEKAFVGGLYALKQPFHFRCSSITANKQPVKFNAGLVEMRWLSAGCWCIHRSVFEQLIAAHPELKYDGEEASLGTPVYALTLPFIIHLSKEEVPPDGWSKLLSEDWALCERWRSLGGIVYADTTLLLNHVGTFSNYLWVPPTPPLIPPNITSNNNSNNVNKGDKGESLSLTRPEGFLTLE
jgi:hypothetical protein